MQKNTIFPSKIIAMKLEDLGYRSVFDDYIQDNNLKGLCVGRVVAEHKERYVVRTPECEYDTEIAGNMRFTALSREDFPAVGDWVAMSCYGDDFAIIHSVFPRQSLLSRRSPGRSGEVQIIAANVDFALLVQALDRDFNINRFGRYLTICNSSGITPLIVLSKRDLISAERLAEVLSDLSKAFPSIPVVVVSSETMEGYAELQALLKKGKTFSLLGSSGVGKSTMINNLSGSNMLETNSISEFYGKGRHVTTHRELIVLESGVILIDNPGMREVGIVDSGRGLEQTYDAIADLSASCKFKDCTHTTEAGCAVLKALETNELDIAFYDNYIRLQKERTFHDTTVAEKRKKGKQLSKIIKDYYKMK
jgi:ribosome biogenesis GTPase